MADHGRIVERLFETRIVSCLGGLFKRVAVGGEVYNELGKFFESLLELKIEEEVQKEVEGWVEEWQTEMSEEKHELIELWLLRI